MKDEKTIDAAAAALDQIAAINGAELLDDTREFIGRFCAFPAPECLDAVTLWAGHAHMIEHFTTTPRLAILSPEPESGKTRVLEVLDLLTTEPMLIFSPSVAAIFRKLAQSQITLLFDEVDTIFSKRGKDDQNEDLRALLNAGYRRGASIPRCVGTKHEVQDFKVFAACALAGIGDLPDTVMTRSIIIRMRRRSSAEPIEQFRTRMHEAPGYALRDRLGQWASVAGRIAGTSWPTLPAGIVDRKAEAWEPLLAVADQAGGHWPETARRACIALCKVANDRRVSLGLRLLSDLRLIFGNADALPTQCILDRLSGVEPYRIDAGENVFIDEDAPWAELHGKPLESRGLAGLLKKYGVRSTKIKTSGKTLQGYRRDQLWDIWQRYLPSMSASVEPAEPAEPITEECGFPGDFGFRIGSIGSGSVSGSGTEKAAPDKESSGGSVGSGYAKVREGAL